MNALHTRTPSRGFTLIELMIAVAVVGILSAVAYPAYQAHIVRTHRAAAAACLQELALQMERRFSVSMAYDAPASLPNAPCMAPLAARYGFRFALPAEVPPGSAGLTATTYDLRAVPSAPQANDAACGTLGLNQQGVRTRTGNAPDVQSCWR